MGNWYCGVMNSRYARELRHHGIIGQKWGVRRFQNSDGSLTPAGRERYGHSEKKTSGYSDVPKGGAAQALLPLIPAASMVIGAYAGNKVSDLIDKKISERKRNLSNKERTKLIDNSKELKPLYDDFVAAGNKMDAARNKIPKLDKNSGEYKKYRNEAIDEGSKYYMTEFGLNRKDARKAFVDNDGDELEEATLRIYHNRSNHPAVKAYREARSEYDSSRGAYASERKKIIKNVLGNKIALSKDLAAQISIDTSFERNSDVPKTGMPNKNYRRDEIIRLANGGNKDRTNLSSTPEIKQASKAIQQQRDEFQNLSKQREKIVNKIPEKLMYNDYWLYRSDDPRAVEYRKIDKQYNKAFSEYVRAAKKEASKLTGVKGLMPLTNNNEVNMWNSFNVKDQVTNAIMYEPLFSK